MLMLPRLNAVPLRNWRDALYAEPVYMSGPSKKGMSKDQYAGIYRTHINALIATHLPHNRLFMGRFVFVRSCLVCREACCCWMIAFCLASPWCAERSREQPRPSCARHQPACLQQRRR